MQQLTGTEYMWSRCSAIPTLLKRHGYRYISLAFKSCIQFVLNSSPITAKMMLTYLACRRAKLVSFDTVKGFIMKNTVSENVRLSKSKGIGISLAALHRSRGTTLYLYKKKLFCRFCSISPKISNQQSWWCFFHKLD